MKTELVVIGASTAGLRTAISAASMGIQTVLVDSQNITKAVSSGSAATQLLFSHVHKNSYDKWSELTGAVADDLTINTQDILSLIDDLTNLTVVCGHAKLITREIVEAAHTRIHADEIVLAMGAKTKVPPIFGIEQVSYLEPSQLLSLQTLPTSMIIVGAGSSACETAWLMARFGVNVTLIERSNTILDFLDTDARARVQSSLESLGVRILTNTAVTKVSENKQVTCSLAGSDKSFVRADMLCLATGAIANTQSMDLHRARIALDKRGFVDTDAYFRTSQENIYAIGSVSGRHASIDAQIQESWLVLESMQQKRFKQPLCAQLLRTEPLVGWIGTIDSDTYEVLEAESKPFFGVPDDVFVKVFHDTHSLKAAVAVGKMAPEILNEFAVLMHEGCDGLRVLQETPHLHFSSGWVLQQLRKKP